MDQLALGKALEYLRSLEDDGVVRIDGWGPGWVAITALRQDWAAVAGSYLENLLDIDVIVK